MRDIADASGLTQSSLYYHFKNKDDLIAHLLRDRVVEVDELVEWIGRQPREPSLLRAAALRWLDRTTPERLIGMRLAQANQPLMRRMAETSGRGPFDRVVDLLLEPDAPDTDRLYALFVFDTVNATLMASRGMDPTPHQLLAVARRIVLALT